MNKLFKEIVVPNNNVPNNIASFINSVRDPNATMQQLMQTNPKFRQFVQANRGKSAEQIARENGIDPALLKMFLK